MAEQFVRLQLTRHQALQLLDAVDHEDDAVTFEGTINGQPVTVRISAAPPEEPRPLAVPTQPERCACKSGSARNPAVHNNRIRTQGLCYCSCHGR